MSTQLHSTKNEEVSQNCFVSDVVKFTTNTTTSRTTLSTYTPRTLPYTKLHYTDGTTLHYIYITLHYTPHHYNYNYDSTDR